MTTCAYSHLRVRIAISTPHTIRASIIDSYATTIVAIAATGSTSIIRTIIIAKCSSMAFTHSNSRTCHITWPAPTVPVRIIIGIAPIATPIATPTITPSAAIAIEPRIIITIEPRIIIAIETTPPYSPIGSTERIIIAHIAIKPRIVKAVKHLHAAT